MELNWIRCKVTYIGSVSAILVMSAQGWSATSPTPSLETSASSAINLNVRDHSDLRHLLDLATNSPNRPNDTPPADEIFWDGLELCGDGVIDQASEQCDRNDLGGATCLTEGYQDGTVSCTKQCQVDASQCSNACPVVCNSDADCGLCGPCFTTAHVCIGATVKP